MFKVSHFEGVGQVLHCATSSSNNNPVATTPEVIQNGRYSQWFSADDCIRFGLLIKFAADASGGSWDIERSFDQSSPEVYATTTPAATLTMQQYTSTGPLMGQFRIHNNTGVTMNFVRLQKWNH